MTYRVLATTSAQRDVRRLPPETKARIKQSMEALADGPREQSEKLVGQDSYRKRVGDYRIVFRVDDSALEVLVVRVKHRRDVYRK